MESIQYEDNRKKLINHLHCSVNALLVDKMYMCGQTIHPCGYGVMVIQFVKQSFLQKNLFYLTASQAATSHSIFSDLSP